MKIRFTAAFLRHFPVPGAVRPFTNLISVGTHAR
jgi:hypothetical protein